MLNSIGKNEYWEKVFSNHSWGSYPPEELVRFIARNFKNVSNKRETRILEIGCGPGPNIWYLVREGFLVAGIDGSSTAISQAKDRLVSEKLPHTKPIVDLQVGNFSSLPWDDEYFDAVIDVAALYANLMIDIRKTVIEIFRTLKPGGLFFGKMFGTNTTGSITGKIIEPGTYLKPKIGPCAGNHIAHFFSRLEILELFSCFSEIVIDHTIRSDQNGKVEIYEWLVVARK